MIGLNIKILRVEKQMTYEQFSSFINVSSRTLRRWESGERDPSLKNLKVIVDRFKIDDLYQFAYGERPREIPKLVYID